MAERGLTQTEVKVPKFLLSVKRKSVFSPRQQGGKLRSSYPLKSVDAICVVNNIFNPFSVNEGDVLVIPNLSRKDLVYKRPNPATRPNDVQEAYVDTGRQSEKDQARIQRLIEKAKKSEAGVKQPMPPNMLQPGQESKTFSGGKIQLGTNLPSRNTKAN